MKTRKPYLLFEFCAAVLAIFLLAYVSVPRFLTAQNINTPENFPDPAFREAVEQFIGVEPGGQFSETEAAKKEGKFDLSELNIQSIQGIEYFKNIEELILQKTNITSLDISQNKELKKLWAGGTPIEHVNLQHNRKLEHLVSFGWKVNNLDLSNLINLRFLSCGDTSLPNFDLSNNTKLESLFIRGTWNTNDLYNIPNLKSLYCQDCKLSDIDLSRNTMLEELDCSRNQLTSLILTNNQRLTKLNCSYNLLEILDISHLSQLYNLDCHNNQLKELHLPETSALQYLYCENNQLHTIDISNQSILQVIHIANNNLSHFSFLLEMKNITEINIESNLLDCDDWQEMKFWDQKLNSVEYFETKTVLHSGFKFFPQRNIDLANCDEVKNPQDITSP